MLNAQKYILEIKTSGRADTDEEIARIGKQLAEGAELNVTDDTAIESVEVVGLSVEVTKTVDLMAYEEEPQI